jgi:hypothetical protein
VASEDELRLWVFGRALKWVLAQDSRILDKVLSSYVDKCSPLEKSHFLAIGSYMDRAEWPCSLGYLSWTNHCHNLGCESIPSSWHGSGTHAMEPEKTLKAQAS